MIKVLVEKSRDEDFNVGLLTQNVRGVLQKYFAGNDEEFKDFETRNNLKLKDNYETFKELQDDTKQYLDAFIVAIYKKIDKFDFRLKSVVKNLANFDNDYNRVTFDLSNADDKTKQEFSNHFFEIKSNSLVDFRDMDGSKFYLTYHRKGIYEEADRLAIVKAKEQRITLLENFEKATDNNFILASYISDMTQANKEIDGFFYTYVNNGTQRDKEVARDEILSYKEKKVEQVSEQTEQHQINERAKEELKQDNSKTRISTQADSNDRQIFKEADVSSVVFNATNKNQPATLETLNDATKKFMEDYQKIELEKIKIRLEEAEKKSGKAYQDVQALIGSGKGILEALTIVSQKYRDEHITNLASILVTKDVVEVGLIKQENLELKQTVTQVKDENILLNEKVEKKEETINSLKSVMEKLRVDTKLQLEQMSDEVESIKTDTIKKIQEIENNANHKINALQDTVNKKEADLIMSEELITKLENNKRVQDNEIKTLSNTLEEYKKREQDNSDKITQLSDKNVDLSDKNVDLLEKIGIMSTEKTQQATTIEELRKELEQLKKDNDALKKGLTQETSNHSETKDTIQTARAEMKKMFGNEEKGETQNGSTVKNIR